MLNASNDSGRYSEASEKLGGYLRKIRAACEHDHRVVTGERFQAGFDLLESEISEAPEDLALRFGVVGDSNAGKSRLIEALIGRADVIPVDATPFTGNVAVLRIRRGGNLSATEIGPHFLEFFDDKDICRCLEEILARLTTELKRISATDEVLRQAASLERQLKAETLSARGILDFVSQTWRIAPGNGRLRMIELGRCAYAWDRLGHAVSGKRRVPVTPEAAHAAIVLPKVIDETITFEAFYDGLERQLTSAVGSRELQQLPESIGPRLAECLYPLIQTVRIDVRVPDAVWDLSDLKVDTVELHDFPGLAAPATAGRDTFLTYNERRRTPSRIHTWIVVVNSTELKGTQAIDLVTQLPKEQVVIVANRFDGLPVWIDKPIQFEKLVKLTSDEAPRISERAALGELPVLSPLTAVFDRTPARVDRFVLVSAMVALSELDETAAIRHRVLGPKDRKNEEWKSNVEKGRRLQERLGMLAGKIRQEEPESKLARWLSAYAEPKGQGGLLQLRRVLVAHSAEFGLLQLANEMEERARQLEKQIRSFVERLSEGADEEKSQATQLRSQLGELLSFYRDEARPPASVDELIVRPRQLTSSDGDEARISLEAPETAETLTLAELIRNETLMRVWEWPQWTRLLDCVRSDNGLVECEPRAQEDRGARRRWKKVTKDGPPLRAGEFHDEYRTAYSAIEAIGRRCLHIGLTEFLRDLEARLGALRDCLGAIATSESDSPITFALRPTVAIEELLSEIEQPAPVESRIDVFWRDRFPFQMPLDKNGDLAPGPYFGWAPLDNGDKEVEGAVRLDKTNHQIAVLRLRSEFSANIERCVLQGVFSGLSSIRQIFEELRSDLAEAIVEAQRLGDAELLRLFQKPVKSARSARVLQLKTVKNPFTS
ncbi:MAG: dynamin family protein [Planctomycetaceae bacterium]|nr:dynamin family protein [Planctomycetaceae bacterium]